MHRVVLRRVPVGLSTRSRIWFETLLREFDIIATSQPEEGPASRLVQFVHEARQQFSRLGDGSDGRLEAAERDGTESVDLELVFPEAASEAALELWRRIEEVDRYCREGDLLTLAPPHDVKRFAGWYLHEISHQLRGGKPQPWSADESGR